jgi:hypothetical protein
MEQNEQAPLFDMELDAQGQTSLMSVTTWTRFMTITGFIVCGLAIIGLLAAKDDLADAIASYGSISASSSEIGILVIVCVIVLAIVLVWLFLLFKASTTIKRALVSRNSAELADGFKHLRNFFILSTIFSTLSLISTIKSLF